MMDLAKDIGKAPELTRRIIFALMMLAVYRFGVHVATPGIDITTLRQMFDASDNSLFGLINLFSGGALENFSIFVLGITPYISVSIIIQVLTPTIPALEALKKEGDAGRRVLTRYTRQGTIVLALFQSLMIAKGLEAQGVVLDPGWMFRITTMITLTAGTSFIMWLGEQITEKGIGNGMSIIIFAGIIARMPTVLYETVKLSQTGELKALSVLFILAFCLASIAAIVFVERSVRKIPIQYPRRMVGKNLAQAQTQYMPLKVNMSGVIPPIFASAFLVVIGAVISFSSNEYIQNLQNYLARGNPVYIVTFVAMIIFFCFFYTALVFNPDEVAENLKKNGGFVPTVRPGKPTSDFLYSVLNRLTVWGAIYISAVCILPELVYIHFGALAFSHVFGGTAILIVVGVTLDTYSQIQSQLIAKNYETFMSRTSKKRGGIGSMGHTRTRLLRR